MKFLTMAAFWRWRQAGRWPSRPCCRTTSSGCRRCRRPDARLPPSSIRRATTPTAFGRTLEGIEMPEGFEIELYAVVPDARHIAVGPQGVVTFVGTRKDKVWAVTDRNKDRVADEVKDFAPSIQFTIPNGVCFSPDGILHIVEQNRVLVEPSRRVLLRGARRAGGQPRPARRVDPAGGGELQPLGPRLRHRAGRKDLHLARPALQRAAAGEARASTTSGASAALSG